MYGVKEKGEESNIQYNNYLNINTDLYNNGNNNNNGDTEALNIEPQDILLWPEDPSLRIRLCPNHGTPCRDLIATAGEHQGRSYILCTVNGCNYSMWEETEANNNDSNGSFNFDLMNNTNTNVFDGYDSNITGALQDNINNNVNSQIQGLDYVESNNNDPGLLDGVKREECNTPTPPLYFESKQENIITNNNNNNSIENIVTGNYSINSNIQNNNTNVMFIKSDDMVVKDEKDTERRRIKKELKRKRKEEEKSKKEAELKVNNTNQERVIYDLDSSVDDIQYNNNNNNDNNNNNQNSKEEQNQIFTPPPPKYLSPKPTPTSSTIVDVDKEEIVLSDGEDDIDYKEKEEEEEDCTLIEERSSQPKVFNNNIILPEATTINSVRYEYSTVNFNERSIAYLESSLTMKRSDGGEILVDFQLVDDNKVGTVHPVSPHKLTYIIIQVFREVGFLECNSEYIWTFSIPQYRKIYERAKEISNSGTSLCVKPIWIPTPVFDFLNSQRHVEKTIEQIPDFQTSIPQKVLSELLPFQLKGVLFGISRNGNCMIADEMGLGKTIQALAIAHYFRAHWPLLIICPSSLRYNWSKETGKWLGIEDLDITMLNSNSDQNSSSLVNIISYDMITRIGAESLASKFSFKAIICDESHYLKNMKAKRTNAVLEILKKATVRILLTGTPALARPIELYPQLVGLGIPIFDSELNYALRYCEAKKGRFGWDFTGNCHLQELHVLLRMSMIRRLKLTVLKELPPKHRVKVTIDVPSELQNETSLAFSKQAKMSLANNQNNNNNNNNGGAKESVRSRIMQLYRETGISKLEGVTTYLTSLLKEKKKFLLFAHHTDVLDALEKHLKVNKVFYMRIDGATPPQERDTCVVRFQNNNKCQVALLSITAAGTGITLTASSMVVFAELYWTPGILRQAEDRVHRIGQKNDVIIHYLVGKNTLDDRIWPIICNKLEVLGETLDGQEEKLHVNHLDFTGENSSMGIDFDGKSEAEQQTTKVIRSYVPDNILYAEKSKNNNQVNGNNIGNQSNNNNNSTNNAQTQHNIIDVDDDEQFFNAIGDDPSMNNFYLSMQQYNKDRAVDEEDEEDFLLGNNTKKQKSMNQPKKKSIEDPKKCLQFHPVTYDNNNNNNNNNLYIHNPVNHNNNINHSFVNNNYIKNVNNFVNSNNNKNMYTPTNTRIPSSIPSTNLLNNLTSNTINTPSYNNQSQMYGSSTTATPTIGKSTSSPFDISKYTSTTFQSPFSFNESGTNTIKNRVMNSNSTMNVNTNNTHSLPLVINKPTTIIPPQLQPQKLVQQQLQQNQPNQNQIPQGKPQLQFQPIIKPQHIHRPQQQVVQQQQQTSPVKQPQQQVVQQHQQTSPVKQPQQPQQKQQIQFQQSQPQQQQQNPQVKQQLLQQLLQPQPIPQNHKSIDTLLQPQKNVFDLLDDDIDEIENYYEGKQSKQNGARR